MSTGNERLQQRARTDKGEGPLRIMPLGDSITAGYTDSGTWEHPFAFGYRAPLYQLLIAEGIDFEFVGASEEPFDNRFGDPTFGGLQRPAFDLGEIGADHHRGYGGWGIDQIAACIGEWVKTDAPDLILLMIGINGISRRSPDQLERLVNRIFSVSPDLSIIAAEITPLLEYDEDLLRYNRYIRQELIPSYRERGFSISCVDQYTQYLTDPSDPKSIDGECFSNGMNHPTNRYYEKIAENWFHAIKRALPELRRSQRLISPS